MKTKYIVVIYLLLSFTVRAQVYTVPMVFHIIHQYGPEDITDNQVINAVQIINADYRKLNADTSLIMSAFKSIAADCDIEFRLANIDPNGKCTNGIDRIVSPLTFNANDSSKLNVWPENEYLNVWVVRSLDSTYNSTLSDAYFPGTAPPGKDGVLICNDFVGDIGTASGTGTDGRELTHAIGHYFNLLNIFGLSGPCGDDSVSDTPPIANPSYGCDTGAISCGGVSNVQNYMDYSFCRCMFTEGQKARMLAALNSPVGGRNNLWSPANAIVTGIANPIPNLCAPIADFSANDSVICSGTSILFKNFSWNGNPTSWIWSFPGGTPSSFSGPIPTPIYYNTPGTYNVLLTVSDSIGSNNITKVITVNSPTAIFTLSADTSQPHHYIAVNNSSGVPPLKYYWNWGDGAHDTIPYPSHTYADSGFYNICLTVTDSTGCSNTFCDSSFYIMRTTDYMVYIDVVPSLNTGIPIINSQTSHIIIYPNPATNQLTIQTSSTKWQKATVSIMNVLDQETSPATPLQMERGGATIDVSNLSSGIYFVSVVGEKERWVGKFVKE